METTNENPYNWTVGYINDIKQYEFQIEVCVKCTTTDEFTYTNTIEKLSDFCLHDVVGVKFNREQYPYGWSFIENIEPINEVIDIFKTDDWYKKSEFQNDLLFYACESLFIANIHKDKEVRQLSKIIKETTSNILQKQDKLIIQKLYNYVLEFDIEITCINYIIEAVPYYHSTNSDGVDYSDLRYRLSCTQYDDNYITSLLPNYAGGYAFCCVNNFPKVQSESDYPGAVVKLNENVRKDGHSRYSKTDHLNKLLEEHMFLKNILLTRQNCIRRNCEEHLRYPINK